jgi:hypothetical protein
MLSTGEAKHPPVVSATGKLAIHSVRVECSDSRSSTSICSRENRYTSKNRNPEVDSHFVEELIDQVLAGNDDLGGSAGRVEDRGPLGS